METTDDPSKSYSLFKIVSILLFVIIVQFFLLFVFYFKFKINPQQHGKSVLIEVAAQNVNIVRSAYPYVDFTKIYPGFSADDIDRIQRESFNVRYVFSPYVVLKPVAHSGKFVNIDPGGFRQGREKQPWPPRKEDLVVFVFGGSTTFSYGLPDDQTLVSAIQVELSRYYKDRKVQCYNFGRGYYFSTQERILFESLLQQGIVPQIAIFVDGLNDFYYFDDWPEYAKTFYEYSAPDLPLITQGQNFNNEEKVRMVIDRLRNNLRLISTVASGYNVSTIFVGQPTPFLDYNRNSGTYPFVHPFAGHELSQWGYGSLKREALNGSMGAHFIWCGDVFSQAQTSMYADGIHYSNAAVKILARAIVQRSLDRSILRP